MDDWLPSLSSEPAGQHHAYQRSPELAPAPPNAPPVSHTAIQGGRGDLSVIPEYENQFAFAHQQPDPCVGFDTSFDADFDAEFGADFGRDTGVPVLAVGAADVGDLSPLLWQYGHQAHPDAGPWDPLGATSLRNQRDCQLAPGAPNQQWLSPSTATPSHTASSVFDTSSIRSGVTAASQSSTTCDICSKPHGTVRQKNRHQRAAHGKSFRCRCLYGSGRRDNYLRHLGNCRKQYQAGQLFACQCGEQTDNFNNHWAHVGDCKLPPGRPANSSRKVQWLPFPSTG